MGTEKPTAHVRVIAANARAARYLPFPIASTQARPPAMTAKNKSSDAAHRDGMESRVTTPCHVMIAPPSHAGGGTRTPDTRIMMADTQGSDASADASQARQGALSSGDLPELGARLGARRKGGSADRRSKRLIVLLHVFSKKTGKLPQTEIKIAQERWIDFKARMDAQPRKPPRAAGRDAP
jgi:Phage derived protein Gp49-like (DUF891)